MRLIFDTTGGVRTIHSDAIVPILREVGPVKITKHVSHVDPDEGGDWWADMSPIAADVRLGPFKTRAEALAAEAAWIEAHDVPIP